LLEVRGEGVAEAVHERRGIFPLGEPALDPEQLHAGAAGVDVVTDVFGDVEGGARPRRPRFELARLDFLRVR
jgi:hypothetical protein